MPKYMGLRLKRYIPEETIFTVRSGANGFTVVRARLNDSTPAASTVRPSTTSAKAGTSSSGGLPVSGGIPQMSHISEAHSAPYKWRRNFTVQGLQTKSFHGEQLFISVKKRGLCGKRRR